MIARSSYAPPARWKVLTTALCLGIGMTAFVPTVLGATDTLPSPVGAGSVLQVLLGLAVVLGMVFAAAWAMRRFNPHAGGNSAIRIVGATSVGNRERVLLLEVDDTWLVVGVAPGRVSSLHTMPRPGNVEAPAEQTAPAGFSGWLKQAVQKRIEEHRRRD
jgi:flagellar protein FliO/FliZ